MRKTEGRGGEVAKKVELSANPQPHMGRAVPRKVSSPATSEGFACRDGGEHRSHMCNPSSMALTSSVCLKEPHVQRVKHWPTVLPFQGFERLDDILRMSPKKIHLDGNEGGREGRVSGKLSLCLQLQELKS